MEGSLCAEKDCSKSHHRYNNERLQVPVIYVAASFRQWPRLAHTRWPAVVWVASIREQDPVVCIPATPHERLGMWWFDTGFCAACTEACRDWRVERV